MIYYAAELDLPFDLSHHGVPGQKWGVQNGPPYPVRSGTKVKFVKSKMTKETKKNLKTSKKVATADSTANAVKKKQSDDDGNFRRVAVRVSSLTDDQLNKRIARLKLEKEYKQLLAGDPKQQAKVDKGQGFMATVLPKVGEKIVLSAVDNMVANRKTSRDIAANDRIANARRRQDKADGKVKAATAYYTAYGSAYGAKAGQMAADAEKTRAGKGLLGSCIDVT
jgi:hypothetical protein